jgi:hypothetical protein
MAELHFVNKTDEFSIKLDREKGEWLADYLVTVSLNNIEKVSYQQMQEAFNEKFAGDFQLLWFSKAFDVLRENGLLVL